MVNSYFYVTKWSFMKKFIVLLSITSLLTAGFSLNAMSQLRRHVVQLRFVNAFNTKNHNLAMRLMTDYKKESPKSSLLDENESARCLTMLSDRIQTRNDTIINLDNAECRRTIPVQCGYFACIYGLSSLIDNDIATLVSLTLAIPPFISIFWGIGQNARLTWHEKKLQEKLKLFDQITKDAAHNKVAQKETDNACCKTEIKA